MKKRSTNLVALLVICAMLISGFAVTAAVDPATTYSFEESFDVAKAQVVSAANVAEAYSQHVTLKVEGENADVANLSIADSKISASAATTYSISSAKAVPMTADYVVDFDVKRTGASGKKAVYVGFRVPTAHAGVDYVNYDAEAENGIWLGIGNNFAVAPINPEDAANNFGTGVRWTGLKKNNSASEMNNHTHFRAYDDVDGNVITIYMVDGETETFYASMTIGTYNSTDDVTSVTFQIMDKPAEVLNIPGQIYSGDYCYPQMVVNSMKPEIGHFGVTGAGLDDAGLTTLKINGVEEDVATYTFDGVDPLDGGVITVEAEASWAADYTLYVGNSQTDEWTATETNAGVNTIEVAGISSVKIAVNTCNEDVDYIINLSDNNPGEVTASPDAGHFETAQEITLTGSGKDNAEIYYTTDGTDPKENGILYEEPFTVPAETETTVKAVEKIGTIYGSVAEFVYDIYVDVEEPAFSPDEGDYLVARTVTLSTSEETTIYYTTDGTDPSDEDNVSRVEYTEPFELVLVPEEKTTYTVKAVAFRDGAYSDVVTKTYGIGVQKERYTIDPAKIVSATDPNFASHDGTPADAYRFYIADAENGWIGVEKGTDNTYQWEMATLKTQVASDKQGYQYDFDLRNTATRPGKHQAFYVYLRKPDNGYETNDLIDNNEGFVLAFMKDEIGVRTGAWGNSASTMISVPGLDLSQESHITITDDFVTDVSVIYVDGEPVAYGKFSGNNYTLTVISTGEVVTKSRTDGVTDTAYPAIATAHNPAEFRNLVVTVGRPAPFTYVTTATLEGRYELSAEIELAKYTSDGEIYYTIDGSDPSDNTNDGRTEYTGPFTITETCTVKAVVVVEGVYGEVYEWDYEILPLIPGEVEFSLEGGEFSTAQVTTLTGSGKPGAVIYYTVDGSDPSDSSNENRITYVEGSEIEIPASAETTVKAVEVIGDLSGEIVTQTYYIGSRTYRIDPSKIVNATDNDFKSHDGSPADKFRFYVADAENGWFGVEKGTDNSFQWEKTVLRNQITQDKLGYQIDFDIKNMDTRPATHQAVNVYLRQNSADIENITAFNNAYVIAIMKNSIGIRNAAWGNHCSEMFTVPDMDTANETHITITDDFVTNSCVVYVNGEAVAYGKFIGGTFTLTSMATGESVSITQNSTFEKTAYPGLSIAHVPALIKDFKVVTGRPAPLNLVAASVPSGRYEDHIELEFTNYNDALTIYYTVDGSDPLDSSNTNRLTYTSTVVISESCTVKFAGTDGTDFTEVYTMDYEIIPYQPADVVFSIETGEYPSAQSVELSGSGKPGAVIYYTKDGSNPVNSSTRMEYTIPIDVPNNAATTIKAVEIIGSVNGTVVENSYYTGTVKSPEIKYSANMQKVVIGEDPLWISPDNRTIPTSFDIVEGTNDTIVIGKNEDNTSSHSFICFNRTLSSANRVFKMEMYVSGATESSDTYRALYIEPRSNKNHSATYITSFDTPRFTFQAKKIGIRTGAWGKAEASQLMEIPGMNLNVGGKIELVDDMVRNVITIYIDGKLVVVAKISGNTITLTAVETGEQIVWSGTVPASGNPRIYIGHYPANIKNLAVTYPYTYDIPVILSHNANSYIGAQTVKLTNYLETPVYYTLDGSDPADAENSARMEYTGPVTIGVGQTTLKAVHYNETDGNYGGYIEKVYKIYESAAAVSADIETLATEELTLDEQKIIISAVFGVENFTIENNSYYNQLRNTDTWTKAFVEVIKEAREKKGSALDFADVKTAAYKGVVIAYFMDNIAASAVDDVIVKANDSRQQYKMSIPLDKLGFDKMPINVQNWLLNNIKDNPIPNEEEFYLNIYRGAALAAVVPALRNESGFSKTERSNVLSVILNSTDILTEDDTFKDWGIGSQKQKNTVTDILNAAKDGNITTIEALVGIVADAIEDNGGSGDDEDGPRETGGTGGTSSFGATSGLVVVPEVQVRFADAKAAAPWAYDAIINLFNKKVIAGYEDGTFRANNSVTREEYVKMLVVALGIYDESAISLFADASSGSWYDSYIASAVNKGIVNGVSETEFGVGVNITRQDMAVIAYRAITSLGKNLPDVQEAAVFADGAKIADYASEAVAELQQANIINGMGDGTFAPGANANRAQAAYIIYSILNAVQA